MFRFWLADAHHVWMGEVKNVLLLDEPLNVSELQESVKDVRYGGIVSFVGEVRAVTGDKDTSKLIYEAHSTMAHKQMSRIAEQAATDWDANVSVAHRLGELLPGDIAVVCVVACAHRAEAFDCCRFLIDRIKEEVPIWKKEFGSTGEAWVAGQERVQPQAAD
jgi:molybdopterin synthase catalytic subunit